jgi:hypothetical protein
VHEDVTTNFTSRHGKVRRFLELFSRRWHAIPCRGRKVGSSPIDATLRELDRQINDTRPVFIEFVGVATTNPPAGLDFCGDSYHLIDHLSISFNLARTVEGMDKYTEE